MKITLWMAMSVNGMIARTNYEEDFISWASTHAWFESVKTAGCVVLGRKAYEVLQTWPKRVLDSIEDVYIVVLSSNKNYKLTDGYALVNSPKEAVNMLTKKGFTEIIITGGSKLNSSFAKAGLIDEVTLNIVPKIIGEGIPLFNPEVFDLKLKFIKIAKSKGKTIQLHYKVAK